MVKRNPKGSVTVESVGGRLRLRLPRHVFSGRQKYLMLYLSDNPMNRKIAEAKAQLVESDIALERFDPSLKKYLSPYAPSDSPPLIEIWDKYAEWKRPQLAPSSLKDYRKTRNHILKLPTQTIDRASEIRNWLGANLSPDAARRCLTQIKAAIAWAMDEEMITADPFLGLKIRERKQRGEKRQPFTPGERAMILEAFGRESPHYLPYVRFLFLTGCRTSEANGLKWADVGETSITFHATRIEGKEKEGLKSQKSRQFPINTQLRELLGEIPRSAINAPYVFRTEHRSPIDGHNFLNKVWRPIVKRLDIPYRPQYCTRHTFITQCLAAGVPVATVAQWTGNSPKTIYSHYVGGDINATPPEF